MSPDDAYWQACAVYRGPGSAPSRRMVMRFQKYGGWHDNDGHGREIEVLTFADERVAEIYESSRRDELIQAIHRSRPHDIGTDEDKRSALTVVLMTAMPIAGLRIDDLRFRGNAARSEAATRRLEVAQAGLSAAGEPVSSRALAAAGRNERRSRAEVPEGSFGSPIPHLYKRSNTGGGSSCRNRPPHQRAPFAAFRLHVQTLPRQRR